MWDTHLKHITTSNLLRFNVLCIPCQNYGVRYTLWPVHSITRRDCEIGYVFLKLTSWKSRALIWAFVQDGDTRVCPSRSSIVSSLSHSAEISGHLAHIDCLSSMQREWVAYATPVPCWGVTICRDLFYGNASSVAVTEVSQYSVYQFELGTTVAVRSIMRLPYQSHGRLLDNQLKIVWS